ncbi:MAG: peptidoglycan DD-metalloendopeptidase family protein [Crocinitomicaceae bacterium]|nr:peptidoglycan DD-metalloendopeptidase family protein [Crocinitomicaceae bacterium]
METVHPYNLLFKQLHYPKDFLSIDLSVENSELTIDKLTDPIKMENWINQNIKKQNKLVAYGGYLEKRKLYDHNTIFSELINENNQRNIHLGIDFWTAENTPVFAPFDGTIHSFNNNSAPGDYGPTIILYHETLNTIFYTLYGHLTLSSLENLKVGDKIYKGEKIGRLGKSTVNGGYAPHLHFQIIKDIQNYRGDYPGVCSEVMLNEYKNNCPNPTLFLKDI